MVEKFEAGKSYISNRYKGGSIFEILYLGDHRAFYRKTDGQEGLVHQADAVLYDEYHEPEIRVVKKLVTLDASGYVACLGEIELTIIDGKIDSVRIL